MLATVRLKQLQDFIAVSSKEELIWINGYLSGLISNTSLPTESAAVQTVKRITITYGTETGNAQKLAHAFAAKAKKSGIPVKLTGLDQYRLQDLDKEEYFFTIISTQGEGEPPLAAKAFYDHIHRNGFKAPGLRYSVLALGDTAYPLFCKTGEDVDAQLERLGGQRLLPVKKCDLDFETDAEHWMDSVLAQLRITPSSPPASGSKTVQVEKSATRKWFSGTVIENFNLTATGSTKKTYHIALAVPDVSYLPGDSMAIVPRNDAVVVDQILQMVNLSPSYTVEWKGQSYSLDTLLRDKVSICFLSEKIVQQYAETTGCTIPAQRADLIQLLHTYPITHHTQFDGVLQFLQPIAPRIYNIASSPTAHPGEVHIIVAQDLFWTGGNLHTGLCTGYLESLQVGDELRFFIQANKRFRLPDAGKDMIMIGPGTGIAPFRAFTAERDATGDTGKNWLFFGETDFTTDFYYQTEWQTWFNTGVLSNVSLAFEHANNGITTTVGKLQQQSAELYRWIENGATVYLCGEKDPMGKAVEDMLVRIAGEQGRLTGDAAVAYIDQLKKDGRFIKDLY